MEDLTKVYTGTALTVNLLKDELEKAGIPSLIKDDYNSGISAGFFGGVPSSIDLYIQEADTKKAAPIVSEFIRINSSTQ